jgi:hypothetical protein
LTEDDDRGYFLEVWVCQNGNFIWMPLNTNHYYETSVTFTDQQGCSAQSFGELRTVEKHGYTYAVPIPWPPFAPVDTPTETFTATP